MAKHASVVYFMQYENGATIKIGFTTDVAKRRQELQNGSSKKLLILAVMPGARELEKQIQDRFRQLMTKGEWFLAEHELTSYIYGVIDAKAACGRGGPETLPGGTSPTTEKKPPLSKAPPRKLKLKQSSTDLPYVNDLEKLGAFVASVHHGTPSPVKGRHNDYHFHGARVLGFLTGTPKSAEITAAGTALISAEGVAYRKLILDGMRLDPTVRRICMGPQQTAAELLSYLLTVYEVKQSTAKQRLRSLKNWRNYAHPAKEEP